MPRERSPKRDKAYELWIKSQGRRELKDIAEELDVSPSQVRKWKNLDEWDTKTQKVMLPNGKGNITKRKPGGQPGNKNAVGNKGGPPLGSQNHFRHGAYERIMLDLLPEDEAEVFEDDETGSHVEMELRRTLAALNVKEIRLMKHIADIKTKAINDQIMDGVSKTNTKGTIPGTKTESVTQNTTSVHYALDKLETELDRVHGRKIKLLSQLESMRVQRERLELERKRLEGETQQNKMAREWITALLGEDMDEEDEGDVTED